MKLRLRKRTLSKKMYLEHRRKQWWHSWFAWYPVRLGEWDYRWLEKVNRKGCYDCGWGECWWRWEYKELKK
jgi:hypothetical protein